MVDYSRWELLAKDEERREQEEAAAIKAQRREKYLKAQKEHADRLARSGQHVDHVHQHTCGCSMQVPKKNDPKDEMPLEKRNQLKLEAIKAAKTDGNRLFKEGDLDLCLQVYERGCLICNGIYGISDAERDEVDRLELALDLNIAQVYLKQKRWTEAVSQCKMALQLDGNSVKAYYRMALAQEGMGEYAQARASLEQAKEKSTSDDERTQIDARMRALSAKERQQEAKTREELRQIGSRIAKAK